MNHPQRVSLALDFFQSVSLTPLLGLGAGFFKAAVIKFNSHAQVLRCV